MTQIDYKWKNKPENAEQIDEINRSGIFERYNVVSARQL